MKVAAVQMLTGSDRAHNLETADRLVRQACDGGATLVVLPETFNLRGPAETMRAGSEALDGPSLSWARDAARRHAIWLLAGSIAERRPDSPLCSNTSCLVSPAGEIAAVYRKIHLFDVSVAGAEAQESAEVHPGDTPVLASMDGVDIGLTVCYDLRFPELYRVLTLAGARIVAIPAAFTERTGRDHWEVLVRARAIENQVFVIAVNQIGHVPGKPVSYGRSMIVDPWGTVLAQAPDTETCIVAELDLAQQEAVRAQLPCLQHRRPDAYERLERAGTAVRA